MKTLSKRKLNRIIQSINTAIALYVVFLISYTFYIGVTTQTAEDRFTVFLNAGCFTVLMAAAFWWVYRQGKIKSRAKWPDTLILSCNGFLSREEFSAMADVFMEGKMEDQTTIEMGGRFFVVTLDEGPKANMTIIIETDIDQYLKFKNKAHYES